MTGHDVDSWQDRNLRLAVPSCDQRNASDCFSPGCSGSSSPSSASARTTRFWYRARNGKLHRRRELPCCGRLPREMGMLEARGLCRTLARAALAAAANLDSVGACVFREHQTKRAADGIRAGAASRAAFHRRLLLLRRGRASCREEVDCRRLCQPRQRGAAQTARDQGRDRGAARAAAARWPAAFDRRRRPGRRRGLAPVAAAHGIAAALDARGAVAR